MASHRFPTSVALPLMVGSAMLETASWRAVNLVLNKSFCTRDERLTRAPMLRESPGEYFVWFSCFTPLMSITWAE